MLLLAATSNNGKLREFKSLLPDIEVLSLKEAGITSVADEDGHTFVENAAKKGLFYSRLNEYVVLAEDSGLCVDYLGGAPGIKSARFASHDVSEQSNNGLLLEKLSGVPMGKRTAHYVAVSVIAFKGRIMAVSCGRCDGLIAQVERGNGGFGYDPLFYLPTYGRTMAELAPEDKNKISHRAVSVNKLKRTLPYCF